ncbi:MAG: apiosidase-like domain-containing protein [Thermoproteota archaeon]
MRAAWARVARYVRSVDPHHNPLTIHPTDCAHNMVEDVSTIDIDMLQTGHDDVFNFENTVRQVNSSLTREPRMPVLVGEATYEGILGASWDNVQRLMFWTCILSGTAGQTYGADGIWQVNIKGKPFGPSPLAGLGGACRGKRLTGYLVQGG